VHTAITTEPIDPAAVLDGLAAPEDGAVLLFVGVVRDHADERPVRGMRYEAYVPMAERELRSIGEEAVRRAGSDRLVIVHRIGELGIGEVSVAIAVATPHRAEAYETSRWIIEAIKRRLPVWKHEHYTDGGSAWVEGTDPSLQGAS